MLLSKRAILKRAEPIEVAFGILFLSSEGASIASSLLINGGIAVAVDAGKALFEDPRFKG